MRGWSLGVVARWPWSLTLVCWVPAEEESAEKIETGMDQFQASAGYVAVSSVLSGSGLARWLTERRDVLVLGAVPPPRTPRRLRPCARVAI